MTPRTLLVFYACNNILNNHALSRAQVEILLQKSMGGAAGQMAGSGLALRQGSKRRKGGQAYDGPGQARC